MSGASMPTTPFRLYSRVLFMNFFFANACVDLPQIQGAQLSAAQEATQTTR